MTRQEINEHVIAAATRNFYQGHSMAGSYYEIDEELGDLYVATQRALVADYAAIDAVAYEQGI